MKITVKKLNERAITPTRGSKYAAGHDLYACLSEPIVIAPGKTEKIGTGIAIAIPEGYWGGIFARSGLATKHGIRPSNCVGVVDADYRGEVIVGLHNDSDEPYTVSPGERVAQLVICPYLVGELEEKDELDETERGAGGFGSTGKK